jgi:hypothetical protein
VKHRESLEYSTCDPWFGAEGLGTARIQYALPHRLLADADEPTQRPQSCAGPTFWGKQS